MRSVEGTAKTATSTWGRVVVALGAALAVVLVAPAAIPNVGLRLGSLVETFRPWLGLGVFVLLAVVLARRSRLTLAAVALPAATWLVVFGPELRPEQSGTGLVVAQHNVSDVNPDPAETAKALLTAGPDLVALQELTPAALPAYRKALDPTLPHHATEGTVGLWSAYPLSDVRPVDIRPEGVPAGWNRGLRATAATPDGPVAVYVAHLPSVRFGATGFGTDRRDESAQLLARALEEEPLPRTILAGDLNSTADDRGLDPVLDQAAPAPARSFGFTWPAAFPLARIDHVLAREATVTTTHTVRTSSDHRALIAHVRP
ncbi:endonuclease/exonuclease/phosphatase family protein [Streptomyces sp. NPDC060194]|uniref:endonuclease/exonuclease/phosphatase family protein n=1 Tax=Streptomyces sp. NPDC060194 TaxID=3347069 RepID=UPI003655A331